MEKYKIKEKEIGDIVVEDFLYRFTIEEKNLLKKVLKKYHPQAVDVFLNEIEISCNYMIWLKEAPDRIQHRDQLQDMLKTFKKSLSFLRDIYLTRIYIPYRRKLDHPGGLLHPNNVMSRMLASNSLELAQNAGDDLRKLIKIIELYIEPKGKKGRPSSYISEFTKAIAISAYSPQSVHLFRVKPSICSTNNRPDIPTSIIQVVGA